MRFMLDTDMCIYLIKKKPPKAIAKLRSLEVSEAGISSITLSELEFGVAKSSQPEKNKMALLEFVAPLDIAVYDDMAAAEYGPIRAFLESKGKPIGPLDTLIAAHARSLGCILVTNNQREFSRVPDLKLDNWI